jgi:hypothetical protein
VHELWGSIHCAHRAPHLLLRFLSRQLLATNAAVRTKERSVTSLEELIDTLIDRQHELDVLIRNLLKDEANGLDWTNEITTLKNTSKALLAAQKRLQVLLDELEIEEK